MHFVYLLRNEQSGEFYCGYTKNLERRLGEHNAQADWQLLYYEAYLSEDDARERERKLKHYGQAREHLKNRIKRSSEL